MMENFRVGPGQPSAHCPSIAAPPVLSLAPGEAPWGARNLSFIGLPISLHDTKELLQGLTLMGLCGSEPTGIYILF